jgi:glycogen(starch) synthase
MPTVLMLGWEFPPNIAGGLGVACHGLASALVKENVRVIFVAPTLHGNEDGGGIELISANTVCPSEKTTSSEVEWPFSGQSIGSSTFEMITIPATLDPYHIAATDSQTVVTQWNRPFFEERKNQAPQQLSREAKIKTPLQGGYGPQLFSEVGRYSQILGAVAEQFEFDMIHAHDWMTFPAGIEARRRSGKPFIAHFHATEFDRAGDGGSNMVYDIERRAVEESDRIVAVSNYTAGILVARYGADPRKIHVVHNGISSKDDDCVRSNHAIGDKVVTFLGRITYQKGPEYFLEAAKRVLTRIPDCHFVMAGSGDALPEMIRQVARARLSSHFHFTGFLKGREIDDLLAISSVYVMPSVSEPFGITPLEAIRAGVPVIISKQSGVSEILRHALQVDFWDVDAISNAICGILLHDSMGQTLTDHGKQEIKKLTWRRAGGKLRDLYRELTSID